MQTLLVLDGPSGNPASLSNSPNAAIADNLPGAANAAYADNSLNHHETLTVQWNSAGEGLPLAQLVAERLLPLREQLNAWTVDMGKTPIHGRIVEEWLAGGEPLSMWWCSTLAEKHPKITLRVFDVLKARTLEMLAEEHAVSEIALASSDTALIETLELFCKKKGYAFRLIAQKIAPEQKALSLKDRVKDGLKAAYYRLPARAKALVRFPAWLWQCKRRLPHTSTPRPQVSKQATLVSYFPNIDLARAQDGRFRSRYWESLHDLLNTNGRAAVNWVFLFFPSNQCDLKQALALRDAFADKGEDGLTFHFLEEFLDRAGIGMAWKRYRLLRHAAKTIEDQAKKGFVFKNSSLNFWPLLKENWYDSFEGWRCLERCLHHQAFKGYAAWCGKQECTVYVQENCPWERMLCQTMHDTDNTNIYGMQHSTVRPTDFRYFDDPRQFSMQSLKRAQPEQWLNNGTAARTALVHAGMPETRSRLVEALRYQYLAGSKLESSEVTENSKKFLLCTSFFADETEAHLRTLADAYQKNVLKGWELCIKAHPYLPVETRLAELFPHGGAPAILNQPIGELLVPGVTVWASNSTTVALEAVYRGLPLLVEAPHNDLNLSPVQDIEGVPFVRTASDVQQALRSVRPAALPPAYLCLDAALPLWTALLTKHGIIGATNPARPANSASSKISETPTPSRTA